MFGLVMNPEYSWLGDSLDGVRHDPCCTDSKGLLLIKCYYNYHDSTALQAASQKEFCCRFGKGKRVLRKEHHYYY